MKSFPQKVIFSSKMAYPSACNIYIDLYFVTSFFQSIHTRPSIFTDNHHFHVAAKNRYDCQCPPVQAIKLELPTFLTAHSGLHAVVDEHAQRFQILRSTSAG
jgi:hypothetical protein